MEHLINEQEIRETLLAAIQEKKLSKSQKAAAALESVKRLLPEIKHALKNGVTKKQVHAILKNKGVAIGLTTFLNMLKTLKVATSRRTKNTTTKPESKLEEKQS